MSPLVVLVPGAPVLVPELAGAAVAETVDDVRATVDLLSRVGRDATAVDVWGVDPDGRSCPDVRGSLRRWGPDVGLGRPDAPPAPDAAFPDPAALGWWFLDRAGSDVPRRFVPLTDGGPVPSAPSGDTLVVIVADGPASLSPRAPVPEDSRGLALDDELASWLCDGGALPDPGAVVAEEIGWWSRSAWLALAHLVGDRPASESASWAPFGVGYHRAVWSPSSSSPGKAGGPT